MRTMQTRKLGRALLSPAMLVTALAAVACQPGPQAPAADQSLEAPPPVAAPATAVEGAEERDAAADTEAVPEPEVAAAEPTATVDISPDLRATDPTAVTLAAGQPQLVEFFAFW